MAGFENSCLARTGKLEMGVLSLLPKAQAPFPLQAIADYVYKECTHKLQFWCIFDAYLIWLFHVFLHGQEEVATSDRAIPRGLLQTSTLEVVTHVHFPHVLIVAFREVQNWESHRFWKQYAAGSAGSKVSFRACWWMFSLPLKVTWCSFGTCWAMLAVGMWGMWLLIAYDWGFFTGNTERASFRLELRDGSCNNRVAGSGTECHVICRVLEQESKWVKQKQQKCRNVTDRTVRFAMLQ